MDGVQKVNGGGGNNKSGTSNEDNKFRTNKMNCFFTQQVINLWSSLVVDTVMAMSIDGFKRDLDLWRTGLSIKGTSISPSGEGLGLYAVCRLSGQLVGHCVK